MTARLLLVETLFVSYFLFLGYSVFASFLNLPRVLPVIPNFDTTSGKVENLLIVPAGSLVGILFGAGVAARATTKI